MYWLIINDRMLPLLSYALCTHILSALNPDIQFCKVRVRSEDDKLIVDTTNADNALKILINNHHYE